VKASVYRLRRYRLPAAASMRPARRSDSGHAVAATASLMPKRARAASTIFAVVLGVSLVVQGSGYAPVHLEP
jgi:hypothetical protein